MVRLVTLATCSLNQWSMDFDGNCCRILESVRLARKRGARYRVGPELEISGYSCEDHFLEQDTFMHAWEVLVALLTADGTRGILCDYGMPVMHKNVRYNCRVFCLDGRVLLLRPKMYLANDGNYRETRWFTPWTHDRGVEDFYLPRVVRSATGQTKVPFGDACIALNDTVLAVETCEELFTPRSPHINLGLDGVEIISNGSGSHHQLRKLNQRLDLILGATAKSGGIYLYANQQGCDGNRMYFDGCAMIAINGHIVAQGSQFSLLDVEVVTATVDLEEVRSARGAFSSRNFQAMDCISVPRVDTDFHLTAPLLLALQSTPSAPLEPRYHCVEEEIALGPACWMWDYVRRSGAIGFFLPLSGGADSSSVCALLGSMCRLVAEQARSGNQTVIEDSRRIAGLPLDGDYIPVDHREFCSRILHTCYMGSSNSSSETRDRAKRLAADVGSYHLDINIDGITTAIVNVITTVCNVTPRFRAHGGTMTENLALQNIQARSRMVLAYFFAQLLPWVRGRSGWLLVLGAGNVDEGLRGYMTKYDCSSADINPIGGISKKDLFRFMAWGGTHLGFPTLTEIAAAQPTPELEPVVEGYRQLSQDDMGMTFDELSLFGRLRKISRCGPYSMWEKLLPLWKHLSPREIAVKVKGFFHHYSVNRHKMTTLTPSYHAENYSPEDNRFDLRQFLYNARWTWQYQSIDTAVEELEKLSSLQKEA